MYLFKDLYCRGEKVGGAYNSNLSIPLFSLHLKYHLIGSGRYIELPESRKYYTMEVINTDNDSISMISIRKAERLLKKHLVLAQLDDEVCLCHEDYEWGRCLECVGTDYIKYQLQKSGLLTIPPQFLVYSVGHDGSYIRNSYNNLIYVGTAIKQLFIDYCKGKFTSIPREAQPIIIDGDLIKLSDYGSVSFTYSYVSQVSIFQIIDNKLKSKMAKIKIAGGNV